MGIVACLLGRGYSYAQSEVETGQALMALVKCGRVESFGGMDCWRLTEKACGAKDAVAESATARNRASKSTDSADKTPILKHPCLDGDGQ